jgi:hypothetical protein
MTTRESKRFGLQVRRPNLGSNTPKKAKQKPATSPIEAKAAAKARPALYTPWSEPRGAR